MAVKTVALYTARPLGWAVAEIVHDDPAVEVVSHDHVARGWWGLAGIEMRGNGGRALAADLTISCLTNHIFRSHELSRNSVINLHPAPLHEYRGCNSYAHAIIDGAKEYGATLHYVTEGIDTGPIIADCRWDIAPDATGRSLHDEAQEFALSLFMYVWPRLREGLPPAVVQSEHGAQYFKRDSLKSYFGSPDPVVRRALTFPPFDNGYSTEGEA